MIDIPIPGYGRLRLKHLVMDYNGTLALDGRLLPGVVESLTMLAKQIEIHIVTADTFGLAVGQLEDLPLRLKITPLKFQDRAKLAFVERLGASQVVAIGNGRNDRAMLKVAAVGIAVMQREGLSTEALAGSDVVTTDILDALNLLRNPQRLIATLRS